MADRKELEFARGIIRSLQEELESAKEQIERLYEQNRQLEKLSITDELTGLYNWRHFCKRLDQEVARNRRQKHLLCLIFLDVDSLKAYNEHHGHTGGNNLLKAIARCISQNIRKDVDSGYRYGGDEFAIILPETQAKQAAKVAKRIRAKLTEAGLQNVSISFGIAELSSETDSEALIKRADEAMYSAKQDSIDKIRVYKAG